MQESIKRWKDIEWRFKNQRYKVKNMTKNYWKNVTGFKKKTHVDFEIYVEAENFKS